MRNLLILILFVFFPAFGEPASIPENMSVVVMQAKDGVILFEKRANLPMTPASTTKLLTVYTALKTLGPDYRFKTQVYSAGSQIYLRFSGDPSLTGTQLATLLSEGLKLSPSSTQLVLDHSAFEAPWTAGTWTIEDTPWYFAAPVHGIILNNNSFVLELSPAAVEGAQVKVRSLNPAVEVLSRVVAVDPQTAETLCQLEVKLPRPHQVLMEGCWPTSTSQDKVNLEVANLYPYESTAAYLKNFYSGKISSGTLPAQARLIAEHQSAPLRELIKPILQDSNNLHTEALTKTLGAYAYQKPTFQAGTLFIKNTLKEDFGPDLGLVLTDGSGLSRNNLISAKLLAQVLQATYANPELQAIIIPALASTGATGTLKTRLGTLNPPFLGKTGGMSQVATLAGYHDIQGDNPLIYVIMLNNGTAKAGELKNTVDATLNELVSNHFTKPATRSKL